MLKENPLISVILPVFNSEKTLERSIKSILNQTFKSFELIIINDCSTDNSSNPFVILLGRLIPAVSTILKFSPNQFKFTKIGSVVVPDF